ncbi:MAG: hypothetical protein K8R21_02430 [Leptospira sp.]|nr:hypothetical protein [Leptospira sp.]
MSKGGYHSRSPEELREYLSGLKKKDKKRNWIQILILVDILILMFVLYFVFKNMNPGSGTTLKTSNHINLNELELYYTRSRESEPDSISYFLFFKNNDNRDTKISGNDIRGIFRLETDKNLKCFEKELNLPVKMVRKNSSDFFHFSFLTSEMKSMPESCREGLAKNPGRGSIYNFFPGPKSSVSSVLTIMNKNMKSEMKIENEKW